MSILKKILWLATLECFIVNLAKTNELEMYKKLINSDSANSHNPSTKRKDTNRVNSTSLNATCEHHRPLLEEFEIPEFMLNQPVYQLAKTNVTKRYWNI